MPKLNVVNYNNDFNQTRQLVEIEYAFASLDTGTYSNTMPFVKCRGYLDECVFWHKNQDKDLNNWGGFRVTKNIVKAPILLIHNCINRLQNNIEYLNTLENKFGLEKTKVVHINDEYIALHFDPKYLYNTIVFSWLTQTLRLLCYTDIKYDFFDEVEAFLKSSANLNTDFYIRDFFDRYKKLNLSSLLIDTPCVFNTAVPSSTVHSYGGIQYYLRGIKPGDWMSSNHKKEFQFSEENCH